MIKMKKQTNNGKTIIKIVSAALIAAAYAVLTLAFANLSYLTVQCRVSEALTILPVFIQSAVPGLTLGCFISNIFSPVSPLDMVFGTAATLIAAILTRKLRNIKISGVPVLSFLMPVIVNGIIIGAEITVFASEQASLAVFAATAVSIAAEELIPCLLLGIPFYLVIEKTKIKDIFKKCE